MKGTHHQGGHHIVSPVVYGKTLFALLFLMGATIAASFWHAPNVNLGPIHFDGAYINNFIALGIAVLKALLVINFFMGVKQASSLVKLWAMTGFVWLTLIFIILNDYGTRKYEPVSSWTPEDTGSAMKRDVDDKTMSPTMIRSRP